MIQQQLPPLFKQIVPLILVVARRTASLTSSTTRVTRVTRVEMVEMEESAFSELESRCHHRGRTVISINK